MIDDGDFSLEGSQRRALHAYAKEHRGIIRYDCLRLARMITNTKYFLRDHSTNLLGYELNLICSAFESYCNSDIAGTVNPNDPFVLLAYVGVLRKKIDISGF